MDTEQDSFALSSLGEALAGLSGKVEAQDARPLAAALVERMKVEQDSLAFSQLGLALAGLSGKLAAKDVQPLAAALVERMETEQDSFARSSLGLALAGLSGKLEAQDAGPLAAALAEAMKTRNSLDEVPRMATAWVTLERVAYAKLDLQKRIQAYIDFLRLPLVVGDARKALLDGLDQLAGEKFGGDLWRSWTGRLNRTKASRCGSTWVVPETASQDWAVTSAGVSAGLLSERQATATDQSLSNQ